MRTHVLPTLFTAFGLVATYWVYALAVVPLVESDRAQRKEVVGSSIRDDRPPVGNYANLLATYFPPDHWTLSSPPKVLEDRQAMLIFGDFEESENGRVRLEPATMIFFPSPREPGEPLPSNAIIMEAPSGAVFQIEGGFRPGEGQIGKFDWGVLQGEVTIRSGMEDDGPVDDLVVAVNDVQINERRIWSNNDVAFQLGPNHGTGKQLEIRFLPAAEAEGPRPHGLDIGGVLSVEIAKHVNITMYVGDADGLFGPPSAKRTQPRPSPAPHQASETPAVSNRLAENQLAERADGSGGGNVAPRTSNPPPAARNPVRIVCDGSFIFHFERRFAQFDKNVRVTRANPLGPPDLLTCQMLDVEFKTADREIGGSIDALPRPGRVASPGQDGAPENSNAPATSVDLRPSRIVAFGAPARVDAPSVGTRVRCERLTYELDNEQVILETISPGHRVTIRREEAGRIVEAESPALSYKLDPIAPRERIGVFRSAGPGWLRATEAKEGNDATFTAEWSDRVILQRDEGQPILSLYGSPRVALGALGHTSGNEMHLWLNEPHAAAATQTTATNDESDRPLVLPDRMRVLGNVRIESPQLVASLGDLHVWFRHVQRQVADRGRLSNQAESTTGDRLNDLVRGNQNEPHRVYVLKAGLLQLDLAVSGMTEDDRRATAEVKNIWATGGLVLQQRPLEPGGAVPLDIRGDRLHVENADAPDALVELFGQANATDAAALASISMQGTTLRGRMMHLDRAANYMAIPSAGNLTMLLDRDLDGRHLDRPEPVRVDWQERLDFDGREAVFSGGVRARGAGGWMQAEKLTARTAERVDFSADSNERFEIGQIRCDGDVVVDRRERDGSGIVGHQHFEVPSLSINRSTGDIDGRGPGWMRSVRFAGDGDLMQMARQRPIEMTASHGPSSAPARHRLDTARTPLARRPDRGQPERRYLRIDFQNRLDGNSNRRVIQVEGNVRAIYGPVDSWDQEIRIGGPAWKKGAMALNCDRLSATEMSGGPRRQDWAELEASGNVEIEGHTPQIGDFAAQAQRLTYDQQKDLLILDGGTNDARLWREDATGTPTGTTVARKIRFTRSRNHIAIEDVRSLDMSQF